MLAAAAAADVGDGGMREMIHWYYRSDLDWEQYIDTLLDDRMIAPTRNFSRRACYHVT